MILVPTSIAASEVGWSDRTLIRAARAGEVPCVRRGRRYYFSLAALRRHFEGVYDDGSLGGHDDAGTRGRLVVHETSGPGEGPLGGRGDAPRRPPRKPHCQDPRGSQGRARRAPAAPRREGSGHPEYPPFGLPRAVGE